MIIYIFIAIVFISEIIIAITLILHMLKWAKKINSYNKFILKIQPEIKEILVLTKNISEQILKLAKNYVSGIKSFMIKMACNNIINLVSTALLMKAGKK